MSDENLWGEEDDGSIVFMPDEAQLDSNGRAKEAPPVHFQRPKTPTPVPKTYSQPEEVEIDEEVLENLELDEDVSNVLDDAHLRLEQGSLYKMIMNHDLFNGVDADPTAVQNVQKEIRTFARERMEIMLGMRKETSTVERLEIDFPFNALEVTTLKALARAASKGATDHSDNYVPEVKRVTEEQEVMQPKRNSINPIGGNSHQKTTAPKKVTPQPKRPLPSKAAAPIKRTRQEALIDKIAQEEGIPRELLEENMTGVGGKSLMEMTEEEMQERNRLVSQRRVAQAKASKGLPMPTYEQMEAKASTQVGGFTNTPLGQKILDAVKKMPVKNE